MENPPEIETSLSKTRHRFSRHKTTDVIDRLTNRHQMRYFERLESAALYGNPNDRVPVLFPLGRICCISLTVTSTTHHLVVEGDSGVS